MDDINALLKSIPLATRPHTKSLPERQQRSRSKSKQRSRPRSRPKSRVERVSLFNIKPVCSMNVQFFKDLVHREPYKDHTEEFKNKMKSKHYGQRKLLLTELYFLAMYAHLSTTVLYVGSAPGQHLNILLPLFPHHTFILYDPRGYEIKPSSRCIIHQNYFTDEECEKYAGKKILFISDIRREAYEEKMIIEDMEMQKRWIHIINPVMSMLKFRIPFTTGDYCKEPYSLGKKCTINYLDGDLLLQPWAPIFSTEMRLIVPSSPKMKEYDITEVDEKMFYHNFHDRTESILFRDKKYNWDYMQECAIIRLFKMKYPKYAHLHLSELIKKYLYTTEYIQI